MMAADGQGTQQLQVEVADAILKAHDPREGRLLIDVRGIRIPPALDVRQDEKKDVFLEITVERTKQSVSGFTGEDVSNPWEEKGILGNFPVMDFDIPDYCSETEVKIKIVVRSKPIPIVLHKKTMTLGDFFSATESKKWEKVDVADHYHYKEVYGWTSLKINSSTHRRKHYKYNGSYTPYTSSRKTNTEQFQLMLRRISIPKTLLKEQNPIKSFLRKRNRKNTEINSNKTDKTVDLGESSFDFFLRVRFSRTVELLTLQNAESFYEHNSCEFKKIRCKTESTNFKYGYSSSTINNSVQGLVSPYELKAENYRQSEFHFLILHGSVNIVSTIMIDLSKKKKLRAALLLTDSCGRNALDIALSEGNYGMVHLLLTRAGHYCFQQIRNAECWAMHHAVLGKNIHCINALCTFREKHGHFMTESDEDSLNLLQIAHSTRYPLENPFTQKIWPRKNQLDVAATFEKPIQKDHLYPVFVNSLGVDGETALMVACSLTFKPDPPLAPSSSYHYPTPLPPLHSLPLPSTVSLPSTSTFIVPPLSSPPPPPLPSTPSPPFTPHKAPTKLPTYSPADSMRKSTFLSRLRSLLSRPRQTSTAISTSSLPPSSKRDPTHTADTVRPFYESDLLEIVGKLIRLGADIGHVSECSGRTPLMNACQAGSTRVVNLLLTYRMDENVLNRICEGSPKLRAFIGQGVSRDDSKMNFINPLQLYSCLPLTANPENALMIAAKNGHSKIVRNLLIVGLNPLTVSLNGNTALHLAVENGHMCVCEIFVDFEEKLWRRREEKVKTNPRTTQEYLVKALITRNLFNEAPHRIAQKNGFKNLANFLIWKANEIYKIEKSQMDFYFGRDNGIDQWELFCSSGEIKKEEEEAENEKKKEKEKEIKDVEFMPELRQINNWNYCDASNTDTDDKFDWGSKRDGHKNASNTSYLSSSQIEIDVTSKLHRHLEKNMIRNRSSVGLNSSNKSSMSQDSCDSIPPQYNEEKSM